MISLQWRNYTLQIHNLASQNGKKRGTPAFFLQIPVIYRFYFILFKQTGFHYIVQSVSCVFLNS